LSFYQNLCIENHLDISDIYSPTQRFFQDWVAPFYLYLQAKSKLKYTLFDDDIQSPKIGLEGIVEPNLSMMKKTLFAFKLEFEHAQIATFTYTKNNKTISASCSSN